MPDVDNEEWHGAAVETDATQLTDTVNGKPIIMRVFEFKLPPLKPEEMPTKEQLLDFHKTKIMGFLWRDELVPIKDLWSCAIANDGLSFKIFTPCQAKAGSVILEKTELLSTYLNAKPNQ